VPPCKKICIHYHDYLYHHFHYFLFIGRIINIVSILGRIAAPLRSPYCTVKFGVEAFSDCLRLEMRRWGVDVIVVEPGDYTTGEQNIYVIHNLTYMETWLGQLLKQMATDRMTRVYHQEQGSLSLPSHPD